MQAPASRGLPVKVFIVEDAPQIRRRLVQLVQTIHGVLIAGEAEGARSAVSGILMSEPDIVLLDLHLAQGTGMDVVEKLPVQHRPDVIIVLSNHATLTIRQACLRAGAHYVFDKTREFRLALDVIAETCQKREASIR
jgi:two-component system, NarL family, response regulator DevR